MEDKQFFNETQAKEQIIRSVNGVIQNTKFESQEAMIKFFSNLSYQLNPENWKAPSCSSKCGSCDSKCE